MVEQAAGPVLNQPLFFLSKKPPQMEYRFLSQGTPGLWCINQCFSLGQQDHVCGENLYSFYRKFASIKVFSDWWLDGVHVHFVIKRHAKTLQLCNSDQGTGGGMVLASNPKRAHHGSNPALDHKFLFLFFLMQKIFVFYFFSLIFF